MTKSIFDNKDSFVFFKIDFHLIILSSIFIFGIIIGTFSVSICRNSECYGLGDYINNYLLFLKQNSSVEIFLKHFIMFSVIIIINFIFGMCIVGNLFLYPLSFVYSYGTGCITTYFYVEHGLNGILFFIVCMFLGLFLFSVNFLISLKHSIDFSKCIYLTCSNKTSNSIKFNKYILKYLIHFLLCVFISVVFSFFSSCFAEKFNI